jgi:hypothetical protein
MNWTVLLPSDTHREIITSITAVLLLSVSYLLTLPRINEIRNFRTFPETARNNL